MKVEINEKEYELKTLTRGQVRQIEDAEDLTPGQESDMLVQLTMGESYVIDALPMPDYVEIAKWAVATNGLDGSAIDAAKKN